MPRRRKSSAKATAEGEEAAAAPSPAKAASPAATKGQRSKEGAPGPAAPAPAASPPAASAVEVDAELLSVEVLGAVESLYADRLQPYGRIIRKRLTERLAEAEEAASCDTERLAVLAAAIEREFNLKGACERCGLRVQSEEGGEWSALLQGREGPSEFVDIYSEEDRYSEAFWDQARAFFEAMGEEAGEGGLPKLPGGRYASARALRDHRPEPTFLRGMSLGEVCHVVQVAINKRKLLGYHNGSVVPYKHSTSMMKSICARECRPCSGEGPAPDGSGEAYRVADLETAMTTLADILKKHAAKEVEGEAPELPLSNIKRLFRSQYSLNLSETSLGFQKISAMLQSEPFNSLCRVTLVASGYVVSPLKPGEVAKQAPKAQGGALAPEAPEAPEALRPELLPGTPTSSPTSPLDSPANSRSDGTPASSRARKRPPPPLSPNFGWDVACGSPPADCNMVSRTFIHQAMPPPTPMGPSAGRRSTSLPPDVRLAQQGLAPAAAGAAEPAVDHVRSCPEKLQPAMVEYIATPGPTPAPTPHGGLRPDSWLHPAYKLAAPAPVTDHTTVLSPPPPPPRLPPPPLESPKLEFQVDRGDKLNLNGLQASVQSGQHSDFPARTPSPQWTTPKGAFAASLMPHHGSAASVLSLATLLGTLGSSPSARFRPGVPESR